MRPISPNTSPGPNSARDRLEAPSPIWIDTRPRTIRYARSLASPSANTTSPGWNDTLCIEGPAGNRCILVRIDDNYYGRSVTFSVGHAYESTGFRRALPAQVRPAEHTPGGIVGRLMDSGC